MLKVNQITVYYQKAIAINDISLNVKEGSIVSIIGANGSGKSTFMRSLSRLVPLTSGEIWFENKRINRMAAHDVVKLGLVHCPEGRKLFPQLNVVTNLKLGASLRNDRIGINRDMDEIFNEFPILWNRRNQMAGTLSGGEQQMLAIARGLMAKPKLFIMDEPSIGLAPLIIEGLIPIIQKINQRGVTVLLAEQNVPLALRVANKGYLFQLGKVVLEGDIEKFKSNELVRKAYLGG